MNLLKITEIKRFKNSLMIKFFEKKNTAAIYIFGKILLYFAAVIFLCFLAVKIINASTNISSAPSEHWAWNDVIGWINFYETNTVNVTSQKLTGYANSSAGDISLDCETTRSGNICSQSNYKVLNNGMGDLSGWAWNDTYGWISFCGGQGTPDCPGTNSYRVLVNPSTGVFTGWAWNDILGWISFNCSNTNGCGTSDYKVITSWYATSTTGFLESSTFDTGVSGGAHLNSFFWRGSQPVGTSVRFEFAVSNSSSGPWTFLGPSGSGSYYVVGPNTPQTLDYSLFSNYRYFRYRVTLVSNQAQTETPRVDEIVINWSP